ncbi:MAG: response regulator [Rhodoferax sp.]|nr:response regulator [Rhodoferax sp.]
MTAVKILYVDDEAMALKYFERLVSPIAPVLTAISVEEGKEMLRTRGAEIAVLVSDQRMPGAHGNELLSYAREHHPAIVRMLTTAYSEMGEAIEAINTGEIYRYITKPWDLESLRADLKNALELAELRNERDSLVREKMLVQQQQLLASRVTQLALVCAGFVRPDYAAGFSVFLDSALRAGCTAPVIDWRKLDHADLMQSEAQRGVAIGQLLAQAHSGLGANAGPSPAQALAALAQALPTQTRAEGERLVVLDRQALTWLLDGPAQEAPTQAQVAWLAWLLWWGQPVQIDKGADGWEVGLGAPAAGRLPDDWMADAIEQIGRSATEH